MRGKWGKGKGKMKAFKRSNLNLIFMLFFCLLWFLNLSLHPSFNDESRAKNWIKKKGGVSISWNLPCFFSFLANSSSIFPHSVIWCRTSPSTQFFPTFSPFSSSSFIITIIAFFFVVIFLGRGANLKVSWKSKSPSTCENKCFKLPWTKLFVLTSKTPSFWPFPITRNAFLPTTTLCGST